VPADPVNGRPAILRLGRQSGLRARVLTRTGEPLAGRKLHVLDGEGYHVPTTDARGTFAVESCYEAQELTIEVLGPEGREHVFSGSLPANREVALRIHADDWPADTPTGNIAVRLANAADVPVIAFHEDGWADYSGLHRPFPAGKILLLVGGAFSGWEEQQLELYLEEDQDLVLDLEPRPEPELEILTKPGEVHRLVVQAGSRSIELDDGAVTHVPAGVEVVVLSEGKFDRRLVLGPLSADATADLRSRDSLLDSRRAQLIATAPREILEIEISHAGAGSLTVRGPGDPTVERTGPGEFEVEAPAGYPVLLRYTANGFAECWASTKTLEKRLTLRPTRLAALTIENETGQQLTVEGPAAGRLEALHPGPLSLILRLADGRRTLLSLELAPGERRTLRLQD
jgi:hypothetical protein